MKPSTILLNRPSNYCQDAIASARKIVQTAEVVSELSCWVAVILVILSSVSRSHYSIHPRDKQDVAKRLVAGALSLIYHRTIVYNGPFPEKISETEDHKIFIEYSKYQQLAVTDENNFQVSCIMLWFEKLTVGTGQIRVGSDSKSNSFTKSNHGFP